MKKRFLGLFLSACMLTGALTGCGSKDASTGAAADPEEAAAAAAADVGENYDGTISLPLSEEKVTLTIWMPADANYFTVKNDYNESEFFQEMERRTNVHLEFEVPPSGEETTAYNLLISSGELPDMICMPMQYPDGMDAAIDDGYYLDLTPYLDSYLYNYNKVRQTSDVFMKDTVTDSGRCAYINILNTEQQGPWVGMQIRQDWLDELGLDTPVTYDDLENVLTQFKEKKGCYAPLALSSNANFFFGELAAGFGVTGDFINKDGTVVAGFATDEWRAYLSKMNDWYEKGLIDPDFMTDSPFFVDTELVTTGQSGVWYSMYTMASLYEMSDPNMVVKALASPKVNADDTVHIRIADTYVAQGGLAISANSENKEIAMKWVDYLYTEEGAALANYGIEGKTFNYAADGSIEYTDDVLNNTEGLSITQAMITKALVPSQIPSHYDWTRELILVNDKDIESYDIWASPDHLCDWVMPSGMSLTSEENQELASYYTDIQTYFLEASSQFISGVLDVDGADWDTYMQNLKSMNVDRCVEIKQAGLDRYLSR
ncbi:MAG: extracellular solute-binding protein [Pseudobutyrivibrio sp.]|nr:extracellular solute-binding protein [Pseudobutyrivibrio sp.]